MSSSERSPDPRQDERVLVLVKGARDAQLTRELLREEKLAAEVCATMADACGAIRQGAACLVLAEEALTAEAAVLLAAALADQPAWSDLPIVAFSSTAARVLPGSLAPALVALGNVVVLDRPIHVRSMLSSVHAAIRSRRRQYEGRRAIEARDTFLAMLGHELRNPLAAIRLAVAALDRKWEGGPRPRELEIADRQSEHLTRLVDDLLDVARVTHGKVVLARAPLDLVAVARSALELLEPRAGQAGVSLVLDASLAELWVEGDRGRLEQVFTNLLSNAIKFTAAGGSITVEVTADPESALVSVTDTGIGLAAEAKEHIFDIFAQGDVPLARSKGGIGVGLALVRNLLRLHGGDVTAESAGPGSGSTFRVKLPLLQAVPAPVAKAEHVTLPAGGKRIVLVEDNQDMRDLMQELLEQVGHDVTCAGDGPAGVDRILALRPDIAFVDLGLPEFDGLELARRVRAAGSAVPLVALSGYGHDRDKQQAAEAGFNDHLTKPVAFDVVERAILRAGAPAAERHR